VAPKALLNGHRSLTGVGMRMPCSSTSAATQPGRVRSVRPAVAGYASLVGNLVDQKGELSGPRQVMYGLALRPSPCPR
jgi:hypothetical protein